MATVASITAVATLSFLALLIKISKNNDEVQVRIELERFSNPLGKITGTAIRV